jgi:hypothetical protein
MSTYNLAQYLILSALCVYILHSIPFVIYLDINPLSGCVVSNPILNRYYQFFFYPILLGILPVSISSVFSFLAFRNVRRFVRRQIPFARRRLDRQLTAMILIRTVIFIILVLPFVIHRIYWLQIDLSDEGLILSAIHYLVSGIIISLFNLNFAVRSNSFVFILIMIYFL